jgi:protein-S-isoprenylcysteine O-methyltransferase Ste14
VWLLVKNLVFTVLVPGTVAVVVPAYLRPDDNFTLDPIATAGFLLVCAGAAGYASCIWYFAKVGRGTPAPIDPPKVVVREGLYRYSRNPMYLSVLSVITGQSLIFKSVAIAGYAAFMAIMFHLFVVLYEEPTLRREQNDAYRALTARVPRWFGLPKGDD